MVSQDTQELPASTNHNIQHPSIMTPSKSSIKDEQNNKSHLLNCLSAFLLPFFKRKLLYKRKPTQNVFSSFKISTIFAYLSQKMTRGGGSHIDMAGLYVYVPAFWGALFAKFGIAIGRFSSETKEPKLHKLGVFGANYCKKHPIWSNWVLFFQKWYRPTDGWEIRQKIGIEIVRFSRSGRHIHIRFW